MKTAYAHCILEFEVPDDAIESGVKQGLLEALHTLDIHAVMATIAFDDEEYQVRLEDPRWFLRGGLS